MVKRALQRSSQQYCIRKPFDLKDNYLCKIATQIFCVTATLLYCNTAMPKDLGTHGVIYPLEEQNPIALIQQKLRSMEESGELKRRNLELQKKTRAAVERPKATHGITRATKHRVFYFDPTYEVKENLYDHQGQCFARKGLRINPLETVNLSVNLVFFDGDDLNQLAWVKEQLSTQDLYSRSEQKSEQHKNISSIKLILTKGAPLKLSEELGIPMYFDQSGILTKKLGIQHVPAMVSQEKLRLKIEEIKLPPSGELKTERGA